MFRLTVALPIAGTLSRAATSRRGRDPRSKERTLLQPTRFDKAVENTAYLNLLNVHAGAPSYHLPLSRPAKLFKVKTPIS
jgi:hypothetical protein